MFEQRRWKTVALGSIEEGFKGISMRLEKLSDSRASTPSTQQFTLKSGFKDETQSFELRGKSLLMGSE